MNNRETIKEKIADHFKDYFKSLNVEIDEKGYVGNHEENLVPSIDNWDEIKKELENGQGSELKPQEDGNKPKFCAAHSSSALAVNNFAPFKKYYEKLNFLTYSGITEASFEKKLSTGISTPNLDFYLETKKEVIGIESKFTEYFSPKLPNDNQNLDKYFKSSTLDYLLNTFRTDLIKPYLDCKKKLHLDVAQLIKHSIGLIKKCRSKKPILIYIYWQPSNWQDSKIFSEHSNEVKKFEQLAKPFFNFIAMSYLNFWDIGTKCYFYEKDINEEYIKHIEQIKRRYLMSI